MVTSEKHQKSLLGGIERLVGLTHPDLLSAVPKILMALYQKDLLDEEVVTQWGTHASRKYVDKEISKKVRKASEPFLKVLIYIFSFYRTVAHVTFSGFKRLMTTTTMMSKIFSSQYLVIGDASYEVLNVIFIVLLFLVCSMDYHR